ncbi:hypothetical protein KPH14_002991 [Odynerus spinipes]|uniref:Odorant receptor n=1 Tax=Odynerus spinipes TaxID=1348599 RepID=A0AAD9VUH2_9HYME|nr:hypothetical protein KPH14_002991 [Odynerus spinipes]
MRHGKKVERFSVQSRRSPDCGMDVEKILNSNRFLLRPTGFWPSDNEKNPTLCRVKAYFAMFFITFGTVCAFCLQVSLASDPMSFAESSVTFAGWVLTLLKCIMVYGKRDTVLFLMVKIEKGKLSDYWLQNRSMATNILKIFYIMLIIAYSITPLVTPGKSLPFDGNYPPIVYEEPWYELVYVIELIFGSSAMFHVMTCDLLLILFICQLCNDLYNTTILMQQYGQHKCKLTDVIKQHIMTLNYGRTFCDAASVLFFGQNCICSAVICVACYVSLTTKNTIVLVKMIGVQLTMLSVLFLNCYGGERICSEGLKLHLTIEENSWRSEDAKAGKDICFVIQRAQAPIQVSVGSFGVMNLKFFSDSVYTALSYAVMLQTVTE